MRAQVSPASSTWLPSSKSPIPSHLLALGGATRRDRGGGEGVREAKRDGKGVAGGAERVGGGRGRAEEDAAAW
jgi:hypothetical protein